VLIILWYNAAKWIAKQTKQIHLFPQKEDFISLEQLEYLGFHWNGKSNVALIWTSQDKIQIPK
jgi:hypothetical protein